MKIFRDLFVFELEKFYFFMNNISICHVLEQQRFCSQKNLRGLINHECALFK